MMKWEKSIDQRLKLPWLNKEMLTWLIKMKRPWSSIKIYNSNLKIRSKK